MTGVKAKQGRAKFPPNSVEKAQLLNHANENLRLTPAARRVLIHLLDRHNPKVGRVFPGQDSIAAKLGLSERWVRRAIQQLKEERYVLAARGKGPGRSTLYTFPLVNLKNGGEAPPPKRRAPVGAPSPEAEFRSNRKCYDHRTGTRVPPNLPSNFPNNFCAENRTKSAKSRASRSADPDVERAKNKSRQRIERELADALGGAEAGYTTLGRLDEPFLAHLIAKIAFGDLLQSDAIAAIRSQLDEL